MSFGWSKTPLYAEQKLANLFYTVEHTLETLQQAHAKDNPLKMSMLSSLEFRPEHGYRAVMEYVPQDIHPAIDQTRRQGFPTGNVGYWFVYSNRVGSLGDDRHKWPVWDAHQIRYEPMPKGMLTREIPRDYLGESFGEQRVFSEDVVIATTIDKNRWRPGPHNAIPESMLKYLKPIK